MPSISVAFNLKNNEGTYYYLKDNASELRYADIDNPNEKGFIEKTSQMSVREIKEAIQVNREDYLNGLKSVKNNQLAALKSDIQLRLEFLSVSVMIGLVLFIIFAFIKV